MVEKLSNVALNMFKANKLDEKQRKVLQICRSHNEKQNIFIKQVVKAVNAKHVMFMSIE